MSDAPDKALEAIALIEAALAGDSLQLALYLEDDKVVSTALAIATGLLKAHQLKYDLDYGPVFADLRQDASRQ